MCINNFLGFSSLLLMRVEPLSSFHPKFALTDQLVHLLHWLEERIVREPLMPTCTWETHAMSAWRRLALHVNSTHLVQATHHLALYPGSRWAGKKKAWYPPFAHVLNLPETLGNQKLLCYIRTTVSAHFLTNNYTY